jgi:hypothetical protein
MMTITLRLRGSVWTATYTGDDECDVRAAFGTNELPTPYTNLSDPALVLRAISTRNPHHTVVLED